MAAPNLDNNANVLLKLADVYGLHQLISEHARITDKSSTLIDLIFTNSPDRVVCSGVSHIGISDHSLVYSTVKHRKFKNFDSASFRHDIPLQNWSNIESCTDPNSMWTAWKQLFVECVNKHAPLREKRTRAIKSPWITPHLKKRMHDRDILKLKASRSNDANDWQAFKRCRNSVNTEIKQTKESYYKNTLHDEGDSRQTWRIIKELTRKASNCCVKEIKNDGKTICDFLELADFFNSHFSSIGYLLVRSILITSKVYYEN